MKLKIGNKEIGKNKPCFIIAEIGSNHNNDLNLAKKMIKSAAESGADAVKFQSFHADDLIVKKITKNRERIINPKYKLIKEIELPKEWHRILADYCKKNKVIFLSSPWDKKSVDVLESVNIKAYKIGSSDLTNHPLLIYIASKRKPILMSVGMSTIPQIDEAIRIINSAGNSRIALMHCIVDYPCALEKINLKYLLKLKEIYKYPVGYSDHSLENSVSVAAVALGAKIVEKHITVSRQLKGPDHRHSATLSEFKQIVKDIRSIEKAAGSKHYSPSEWEFQRIKRARRSAYAIVDIGKGIRLRPDMFKFLRPGGGIKPKYFRKLVGKKTKKHIKQYEMIQVGDLK